MSNPDIQWWSFVIGLLVFAAIIGLVYLRRCFRSPEAAAAMAADRWNNLPGSGAASAEAAAKAERRRPAAPPPTSTPHEQSSAVRSLLLRVVAERAPAGWSVLVLTPPAHADRMTWHVHLAPSVALDLKDGRSVPAAPPAPSHEWRIAGGRTVGVGDGELDPPPTDDAVAVRVTGPYLVVVVEPDADGSGDGERLPRLTARVVTTGDALPEPRALLSDQRAVQAALREAIELAIGTRMSGTLPALGYRLTAWTGHEQTWLAVSR